MDKEKAEEIEEILIVLNRRCELIVQDINSMRKNIAENESSKILKDVFFIQSTITILATGINSLIAKNLWLFEHPNIGEFQKKQCLSNAKNSEFMLSGCAEAWRAYNRKINELIKK